MRGDAGACHTCCCCDVPSRAAATPPTPVAGPWRSRAAHVSQLADWGDGGGLNGHNNCFEACLTRLLREYPHVYPEGETMTNRQIMSRLRQLITGRPDQASQGPTTVAEAATVLAAFGLRGRWTTSLASAAAAPWAICLVAARRLLPAQYPPWWLADDTPDHFILWMPNNQFNDPLAYWNGQRDCTYVLPSLRAAWGGAFVVTP